MTTKMSWALVASAAVMAFGSKVASAAEQNNTTFFVTSVGSGKGADLGGIAGADKHCQSLAQAAGAGKRTWRAYLSTTASGGGQAINARDRIGKGPWQNAKDQTIARSVDELHTTNNINRLAALTEKGAQVNGFADRPNTHDILTGSAPDGRAMTDGKDTTCGNWTKSGEGAAMVGHHDRIGLTVTEQARSWNSSHPSRGCSQENLVSSGGGGLFYCFAAN
jgi:hypothetical protein